MRGSCSISYETSGTIKYLTFLGQLIHCQLLKDDSVTDNIMLKNKLKCGINKHGNGHVSTKHW
jgi:hypothetical protein